MWGATFSASRVLVELFEDQGPVPTAGAEPGERQVVLHRSDVDATLFLYEAWTRSALNGSALGNETIAVDIFGAEPADASYACRFTSVADPRQVAYSRPVAPNAADALYCEVPPWGTVFVASLTTLDIVRGYSGGQAVAPAANAAAGTVVVPNVGDRSDFRYLPVWRGLAETVLFGAKGGDTVDFTGGGFNHSARGLYRCRFEHRLYARDGNLTIQRATSARATANSTTAVRCVTPQ